MKYPTLFSIETMLGCNLGCVECAIGAGLVRRKYGYMRFEQFAVIAEKIKPYCTYAYLHLWGEPMINPDIIPIIQLASTFTKTNISTNANILDESLAEKLICSGVTDIIVSIDGMSQRTYGIYRRRGNLSKALLGLTYLVKFNMLTGGKVNIISQFVVFDHNKHEMEKFYNFCKEIGLDPSFKAPYIRNNSYLQYSGIQQFERKICDDEEVRKKNMSTCNVDDSFTILLDGSVVACCYDHNGKTSFSNIFFHSVEEIWNNEKYSAFRNNLKSRNTPSFCTADCLMF